MQPTLTPVITTLAKPWPSMSELLSLKILQRSSSMFRWLQVGLWLVFILINYLDNLCLAESTIQNIRVQLFVHWRQLDISESQLHKHRKIWRWQKALSVTELVTASGTEDVSQQLIWPIKLVNIDLSDRTASLYRCLLSSPRAFFFVSFLGHLGVSCDDCLSRLILITFLGQNLYRFS